MGNENMARELLDSMKAKGLERDIRVYMPFLRLYVGKAPATPNIEKVCEISHS